VLNYLHSLQHTTIVYRSGGFSLTSSLRQIGYSPIGLSSTLFDKLTLSKKSLFYCWQIGSIQKSSLYCTFFNDLLLLSLLNLPFESRKASLSLFEYSNSVLVSNCMLPNDNYLISTVFPFEQWFPHVVIGSVLPGLSSVYLDSHSPLLSHCSNPACHHIELYIGYHRLVTITHSQYQHPHNHNLSIIDRDWMPKNLIS